MWYCHAAGVLGSAIDIRVMEFDKASNSGVKVYVERRPPCDVLVIQVRIVTEKLADYAVVTVRFYALLKWSPIQGKLQCN
jgi:hypothetical protein